MRRTKPPVGWEHVKNCFPVPNELLEFDLPGGAIAVYIYLLRHADRRVGKSFSCISSYALDGAMPRVFATVSELRNSGSSS